MSFKIILTEDFKREFKRLHKKHTSLPEDIANLVAILSNDPITG
jgi:mRNA-degrading endonuclease YafQ of YafQ-DinJ toxin-antitoxin module